MRLALILTVIFWQSYAEVRRVRSRVVQTPNVQATRTVTRTPDSRTVETVTQTPDSYTQTVRAKSCTPVRVNGEIIWRCK